MRRLRLSRETVRLLDRADLLRAAGGVSAGCPSGGIYPKYSYCNCPPTTGLTLITNCAVPTGACTTQPV